MFILKDLFRFRSNSKSTESSENPQSKEQETSSNVQVDQANQLRRSKSNKIRCWLNRDYGEKQKNSNGEGEKKTKKLNDSDINILPNMNSTIKENKASSGKDKDIVSLQNANFDDLSRLYYDQELYVENEAKQKPLHTSDRKIYNKHQKVPNPYCGNHQDKRLSKNSHKYHRNESSVETLAKEEFSSSDEEYVEEEEESVVPSFSYLESSNRQSSAVVMYPGDLRNNSSRKKTTGKINSTMRKSSPPDPQRTAFRVERMQNQKERHSSKQNQQTQKIAPDEHYHMRNYYKAQNSKTPLVEQFVKTQSISRERKYNPDSIKGITVKENDLLNKRKRYDEYEPKDKKVEYLLIPAQKRRILRSKFSNKKIIQRSWRKDELISQSSTSDLSEVNYNENQEFGNPSQNRLLRNVNRKRRSQNFKTKQAEKKRFTKNNIAPSRSRNFKKNIIKPCRSKFTNKQNGGMVDNEVLYPNKLQPKKENSERQRNNNNLKNKQAFLAHRQVENKPEKEVIHNRNIFVEKGIGEPNRDEFNTMKADKQILQNIIHMEQTIVDKNIEKMQSNFKPLREISKVPIKKQHNITHLEKKQDQAKNYGKKANEARRAIISVSEEKLLRDIDKGGSSKLAKTKKHKNIAKSFVQNKKQETSSSVQNNIRIKSDSATKITSDFSKGTPEESTKQGEMTLESVSNNYLEETREIKNFNNRNQKKLKCNNNITTFMVFSSVKKPKTILNKTIPNAVLKRNRNLHLFKLLEEMLGKRKIRRSKPKGIGSLSSISLVITKKEKIIYKDLHRNIIKRYRTSTTTSGAASSITSKIDKVGGIRRNKHRSTDSNLRKRKIKIPQLEISILPGIDITPSLVKSRQKLAKKKKELLQNISMKSESIKTTDSDNKNTTNSIDSTNEKQEPNCSCSFERIGRKLKTLKKISVRSENRKKNQQNTQNEVSNSVKQLPFDVTNLLVENNTEKCLSCPDNHSNANEKSSFHTLDNLETSKCCILDDSSVVVLQLGDFQCEADIQHDATKSVKDEIQKIIKHNIGNKIGVGAATNVETLRKPPVMYPNTMKKNFKEFITFKPLIHCDFTESKPGAPNFPSGDTLLLTITDSEIWSVNQQEERCDSNERMRKLEKTLQQSIVNDLKNCSKISEKNSNSSPEITFTTTETQKYMEEWENLVRKKALERLVCKKKTSPDRNESEKNQKYVIKFDIDTEIQKTHGKDRLFDQKNPNHSNEEIEELHSEDTQSNFIEITYNKKGSQLELDSKNQKCKKKSNLSVSPLETVFETEEQTTEVIDVQLVKKSDSYTRVRIIESNSDNTDNNNNNNCESHLSDFEEKLLKLKCLDDLVEVKEQIDNIAGIKALNIEICIDDNTRGKVNFFRNVKSDDIKYNHDKNEVENILKSYNLDSIKECKTEKTDRERIRTQVVKHLESNNDINCEKDRLIVKSSSTESLIRMVEDSKIKIAHDEQVPKMTEDSLSKTHSDLVLQASNSKVEKNSENNSIPKCFKKNFSRLPVYVGKQKSYKDSSIQVSQISENKIKVDEYLKPLKKTPIKQELESKSEEFTTLDSSSFLKEKTIQKKDKETECNLEFEKVDNMINTDIQERKDQTTMCELNIKQKECKSVSNNFDSTKSTLGNLKNNRDDQVFRRRGPSPHRCEKFESSCCHKKNQIVECNLERYDDLNPTKYCIHNKKYKYSGEDTTEVSDVTTEETNEEEEEAEIDSDESSTIYSNRKQCEKEIVHENLVSNITTRSISEKEQSSKVSDLSKSVKTTVTETFEMSTTTNSVFNRDDDLIPKHIETKREKTPSGLILALDQRIRQLSEQIDTSLPINSNSISIKNEVLEFVKNNFLDTEINSLKRLKSLNRGKRNNRFPRYNVVSKSKCSINKFKSKLLHKLSEDSNSRYETISNVNTKSETSPKHKIRKIEEPVKSRTSDTNNNNNLSSFHKRKLYWESLKQPAKAKKSKYFLLLEKKKTPPKRISVLEKILRPNDPSIFFKSFPHPLSTSSNGHIVSDSSLSKSNNNLTISNKKKGSTELRKVRGTTCNNVNQIVSYENEEYEPSKTLPFLCGKYPRVRHSSSLILKQSEIEENNEIRPSSVGSARQIVTERIPTFFSYKLCDKLSPGNERTNTKYHFLLNDDFDSKSEIHPTLHNKQEILNSAIDSEDLNFLQNYDISQLCRQKSDHPLEKQFIDKVRNRAKELFKNFLKHLKEDDVFDENSKNLSKTSENVESNLAEGFSASIRNSAMNLHSLNCETYDTNEEDTWDVYNNCRATNKKESVEEETISERDTEANSTYFEKTREFNGDLSEYSQSEEEESCYPHSHRSEPRHALPKVLCVQNTFENQYKDQFKRSLDDTKIPLKYYLNQNVVDYNVQSVTLARAEIGYHLNHLSKPSKPTNMISNMTGNELHSTEENKLCIEESKTKQEQTFEAKTNFMKSSEKNIINNIFAADSLNGDVYCFESENSSSVLDNLTPRKTEKSLEFGKAGLNMTKHVLPEDKMALDGNENLSTNSLALENEFINNKTIIPPEIQQQLTEDCHSSNTQNFQNQIDKKNSTNLTECFKNESKSESSTSSSSTIIIATKCSCTNKSQELNVCENFPNKEMHFGLELCKTSSSTSSTTKKARCLIIDNCNYSDDEKFLQSFTETSSFSLTNLIEQKDNIMYHLKDDSSKSSSSVNSFRSNTSTKNKQLIKEGVSKSNVDKNEINFSKKSERNLDSQKLMGSKEKDIQFSREPSVKDQHFEKNNNNSNLQEGSDDCIKIEEDLNWFLGQDQIQLNTFTSSPEATEVYKSNDDPLFSFVRVYHEKLAPSPLHEETIKSTTQNNSPGSCNEEVYNDNNSETSSLADFEMNLTNYGSSPNLIVKFPECQQSTQNQYPRTCPCSNSGTSKLTPEEMDSGFESAKNKINNSNKTLHNITSANESKHIQNFDKITYENSVQNSISAQSIFSKALSCKVLKKVNKHFFHNVKGKTSRKKGSVTMLTPTLQSEEQSPISFSQSAHWNEFWENVGQLKNCSVQKGTTITTTSCNNIKNLKSKEQFYSKQIFDEVSSFQDTSISSNGDNSKWFPIINRNFFVYNVYVYHGIIRCDKSTQTESGVDFTPCVTVGAERAISKLFCSKQQKMATLNTDRKTVCDKQLSKSNKITKSGMNELKSLQKSNTNDESYVPQKNPALCSKLIDAEKPGGSNNNVQMLCETTSFDDPGCRASQKEQSSKILHSSQQVKSHVNKKRIQGQSKQFSEESDFKLKTDKKSATSIELHDYTSETLLQKYDYTTNTLPLHEKTGTVGQQESTSTKANVEFTTVKKMNEPFLTFIRCKTDQEFKDRQDCVKKVMLERSCKMIQSSAVGESSNSNANHDNQNFRSNEHTVDCDTNRSIAVKDSEELYQKKITTNTKHPCGCIEETLSKNIQQIFENAKKIDCGCSSNKIRNDEQKLLAMEKDDAFRIDQDNEEIEDKKLTDAEKRNVELLHISFLDEPNVNVEDEEGILGVWPEGEVFEEKEEESEYVVDKIDENVKEYMKSMANEGKVARRDTYEKYLKRKEAQLKQKMRKKHQKYSKSESEDTTITEASAAGATQKIKEERQGTNESEYETHLKEDGMEFIVEDDDDYKPDDKRKTKKRKMIDSVIENEVEDESVYFIMPVPGDYQNDEQELASEDDNGSQFFINDQNGEKLKYPTELLDKKRHSSSHRHNVQEKKLFNSVNEDKNQMLTIDSNRSNLSESSNQKKQRPENVAEIVENKAENGGPSKNKNLLHCFASESDLLNQREKNNYPLRASLTDKEIFEKLLASYEKGEEIAENISKEEDFFEPNVYGVNRNSFEKRRHAERRMISGGKSNVNQGQKSNKDDERKKQEELILSENPNEADQSKMSFPRQHSAFSDHKSEEYSIKQISTIGTVQNNERVKLGKLFSKIRFNSSKQDKTKFSVDSVNTEIGTYRKIKTKSITDGKYSISSYDEEIPKFPEHKKSGKHKLTEEDMLVAKELGKCFRRGFRPESTTLSGEPCLNLSAEDELSRLNVVGRKSSSIEFSERDSPLEYLLNLGFSIDEASNAMKNIDVKNRLAAAITEAKIWVNRINANQGTLLYLAAYKSKPSIMRYFLQLIEAIINKRINDAVKLDAFIKLLEKIEEGDISIIKILGFDQLEDEVNEEIMLRKQLRQLFLNIFKIAEKEANLKGQTIEPNSVELLRILAVKYRTGLQPHLDLIAKYIGQGLLLTDIQLEAAMIYLSRLDTADVNLAQFEAYCSITCEKKRN